MNIVIFTGGNPPDSLDFLTFYGRIVQDDDVVITADSGIDTLNTILTSIQIHTIQQRGNSTIQEPELHSIQFHTTLKPSFILGDMDSIRDKGLIQQFPDAEILEFNPYKDFTDTELSLKKAYEFNSKANIILVGGNGGRPDHFLGILETFCSDLHPSIWLCGPQVIYYLADGETLLAENLNQNDIISIARVYSGSSDGFVTSTGLEWG
ncbi:MAG: hypothetical protein J6Y69_06745, partial [Treponema sp.]|nr:hypothetical protein [Treponema sp.]